MNLITCSDSVQYFLLRCVSQRQIKIIQERRKLPTPPVQVSASDRILSMHLNRKTKYLNSGQLLIIFSTYLSCMNPSTLSMDRSNWIPVSPQTNLINGTFDFLIYCSSRYLAGYFSKTLFKALQAQVVSYWPLVRMPTSMSASGRQSLVANEPKANTLTPGRVDATSYLILHVSRNTW